MSRFHVRDASSMNITSDYEMRNDVIECLFIDSSLLAVTDGEAAVMVCVVVMSASEFMVFLLVAVIVVPPITRESLIVLARPKPLPARARANKEPVKG